LAGRILTIIGAKSGSGTTIIATNLALVLSRETRKRVVLIDLNLEARNEIAQVLDIANPKTVSDLLPLIDKLDSKLIRGYLTIHKSGVGILPLALEPSQIKAIASLRLRKLLEILSGAFDYIIVDGQSFFSNMLITALEVTDTVLVTLLPDILCLHQARKKLETIGKLNYPLGRVRLILNQSDLGGALKTQEINKNLEKDIFANLPCDEAVTSSINKGVPLVIGSPRSPLSKGIRNLAFEIEKQSIAPLEVTPLTKEKISLAEREIVESERAPAKKVEAEVPEDKITALKQRVHKELVERLDLKKMDLSFGSDAAKDTHLRQKVERTVNAILSDEKNLGLIVKDYKELIKEIVDEALGLGPLEDLLRDPSITEIMVNKKDQIYIERAGKLSRVAKGFISDQQIIDVIRRIIAPIGRRIDESIPMVDARLKDGSRVNAIIPPLALQGPMITIRRFPERMFNVEDLIKLGTLTSEIAEFLKACVLAKKDVAISGGTGSGKTTLLNVLSSFIPPDERIITMEDTAELRLAQEHVGTLEARPPNIEGKGEITIRSLVRNALRMRPDRIVIGECRGGEALDMLQAMNTGHEGSLTTIHANSPQDLITRLETMVLMASMELPVRIIRQQISSAIDIIIQIARLTDGSRKIIQISEITGQKDDLITMEDIFIFKQTGVGKGGKILGNSSTTGYIPSFASEFKVRGIPFSMEIFQGRKEK